MTPHEELLRKIERSSLGTPVVLRIRARTTREVTEVITRRALGGALKDQTSSAGIVSLCLYSSTKGTDTPHCVDERRTVMAHGKTTGSKAASNAGKVLSNPKSSKAAKSAAASALGQRHGKGHGKGGGKKR